MPITRSPESGTLPLPLANTYFEVLQGIAQVCFNSELLRRQSELTRYQGDHAPIKPGSSIVLEVIEKNGAPQPTRVENVEHIMSGARIEAGAVIGDYAVISCNTTIGEGAEVGMATRICNGAEVGRHAITEYGATLLTNSLVGEECVLGEGAELSYDVVMEPGTTIKPECILYE